MIVADKRIVLQKASGNGIFDGHDTAIALLFIGRDPHQFLEAGAANHFGVFAIEMPGRHLVETAFKTLYRYFFTHALKIKNPGLSRDL